MQDMGVGMRPSPKPDKLRLDKLLVDQGHAPTREKAQFLIMSGNVLVNDQKIDKCGQSVPEDAQIRLLTTLSQYVSRGADKLAKPLQEFGITLTNKHAFDIGISTGGFTDYLLQNGAASVIGIDVGYGQIDYKLRIDPRLLLIERTNARHLTQAILDTHRAKHPHPEKFTPKPSLVVMDLSFISVTKVLPVIQPLCDPETDYVILIKPQFESQKSEIGKGGIIKDPAIRHAILDRVSQTLSEHFLHLATCPSPITGTKGNQEFLFWLRNLK